MTRAEKMDHDIAWILAEIRHQNSTDEKLCESGYFEFEEEGSGIPSRTRQASLVEGYLQRAGVLKVIKKATRQAFVKHEYGSDLMTVDDGLEIEIDILKFKEMEASLKQRGHEATTHRRVFIVMSDRDGISRVDESGQRYEIRGNRKEILFKIAKEGPIRSLVFQRKFGYTTSRVTGEIDRINDTFRKKLCLADPIVEHSTSSGYSINTKVFDIELQ